MLSFLFVCLLAFPAHAQYQYGGTYNTARVAYMNQATMTQAVPLTCKRCWSIGWIILWDACPDNAVEPCDNAARSDDYVEAGIGQDTYDKWTSKKSHRTALWYASQDVPWGVMVGTVPLGTPVTVSMVKNDGQGSIAVRWDWPGGSLSKVINVPHWLNGPGIHPVKAEMYGNSPPVHIKFQNVPIWPQDITQGVYLDAEGPYSVSGTLQNFTVSGR